MFTTTAGAITAGGTDHTDLGAITAGATTRLTGAPHGAITTHTITEAIMATDGIGAGLTLITGITTTIIMVIITTEEALPIAIQDVAAI